MGGRQLRRSSVVVLISVLATLLTGEATGDDPGGIVAIAAGATVVLALVAVAGWRRRTRRLAAARAAFAALAGAGVALTGCGAQGAPLPPPPATIPVAMRDYAFDHRTELPPGRAVFRVRNAGQASHQLILLTLPPDTPPVGDVFQGSGERRGFSPLAILPVQPSGGSAVFAYDFAPGRYGLVCILKEPGGRTHAQSGMASEFRVRGQDRSAPSR